ncbi:MAG: hypothetical protein ACLQAT_20240 [Candidatus Binataceae bacterium]
MANLDREIGFDVEFFGVGESEISENIPAANFIVSAHTRLNPQNQETRRSAVGAILPLAPAAL